MRRRAFLGASGALMATWAASSCSSATPAPGPVIQTDSGEVRGTVSHGVHRFLGIPYAEPPFGANRFKPARPRRPWLGVLAATEYGAACPQTGGAGLGDLVEGEDCLNLNIWTPEPGAANLPVMVWAHGGGQVSGSGSQPVYDGTHFANDGVVLITCNRRLGAEGYLYLSELFDGELGPGDLGISDLIEVLRWVKRNVAQFGGNPDNVTLFGESGGGAATQAVVANKASAGLVHRVIPQSGGHAAQRPESATQIARAALQKLAIKPGDVEALQRTPWQRFVEIYPELPAEAHGRPQLYLPVISEAMPHHPADATAAGFGADVDYLIGTCRDEMNLFDALPGDALTGFKAREQAVLQAGGANLDAVHAAYRKARPELDDEAVALASMGDMWFRVPSLRIADQHVARGGRGRTFMYLFTWESPSLGAAHAMDLLVFGNGLPFPGLVLWRDGDSFGQQMRRSWVNFARTGNPSQEGFEWPAYELTQRKTVAIDEQFSVMVDPYQHQRDALGDVLTMNWQQRGV